MSSVIRTGGQADQWHPQISRWRCTSGLSVVDWGMHDGSGARQRRAASVLTIPQTKPDKALGRCEWSLQPLAQVRFPKMNHGRARIEGKAVDSAERKLSVRQRLQGFVSCAHFWGWWRTTEKTEGTETNPVSWSQRLRNRRFRGGGIRHIRPIRGPSFSTANDAKTANETHRDSAPSTRPEPRSFRVFRTTSVSKFCFLCKFPTAMEKHGRSGRDGKRPGGRWRRL